jgi:hypothetical protein
VHLLASLPANSTAQQPIPQAIDPDDHVLFASFDFGYAVGFQAQLFSDKRFNEHLGSFPFFGCVETTIKGYRIRGALLFAGFSTPETQKPRTPITLLG